MCEIGIMTVPDQELVPSGHLGEYTHQTLLQCEDHPSDLEGEGWEGAGLVGLCIDMGTRQTRRRKEMFYVSITHRPRALGRKGLQAAQASAQNLQRPHSCRKGGGSTLQMSAGS